MLNIKFIKDAVPLMRDAIEEAKLGGEIINTRFRELNGELYFQIPAEEIDLWLDLLDDLGADYDTIIQQIEDLRKGETWQKIGGEPMGEARHGSDPERGSAGLAAGEPSGGRD